MTTDNKRFRYIPKYTGTNLFNWVWSVETVVNGLVDGKSNNVQTITLAASTAATTVTFPRGRIGQKTTILFSPTTANAAAEFASGNMYVSGRSILATLSGIEISQFTVAHTNDANTDKIFDFAFIG